MRNGDVLIGFESSGLHTNGYSLARRIVRERLHLSAHDPFPGEAGATTADVLLRVHRSYLAAVRPVLGRVHALAHITGGGLPGNLNRALPKTLDAIVETGSWEIPSVFRVLETAGRVERGEMYRAFNLGVGMVVVADPADASSVLQSAAAAGVHAWPLGTVAPGSGAVQFAAR